MNRLTIIGDSNVYRNVTVQKLAQRLGKAVTLHKATRKQTFELSLSRLSESDEILVVSALSNLLCDAFVSKEPTDPELEAEVTSHLKALSSVPFPKHILIIPPFFREVPTWFGGKIPLTLRKLAAAPTIDKRIIILPEFKVNGTDLIDDGVHLEPQSGVRFYDYLVNCAMDIFDQPSSSSTDLSSPSTVVPEAGGDVISFLKTHVLPKIDVLPGVQTKVMIFWLFIYTSNYCDTKVESSEETP